MILSKLAGSPRLCPCGPVCSGGSCAGAVSSCLNPWEGQSVRVRTAAGGTDLQCNAYGKEPRVAALWLSWVPLHQPRASCRGANVQRGLRLPLSRIVLFAFPGDCGGCWGLGYLSIAACWAGGPVPCPGGRGWAVAGVISIHSGVISSQNGGQWEIG